MNCRQIQKWLHLYGEGELASRQKTILNDHLHSCEACRTLFEHLDRTRHLIHAERNEVPVLNEPEALTHRIMHAVQDQTGQRWPRRMAWGNWLGRMQVRMAMGCVLIALLSSFFIQEIHVMNRVAALENKVKTSAALPKSTFARCLSSAEAIIGLFNGEAEEFIAQARAGNIRISSISQYIIKFQQMSTGDQMRILRVYRNIRNEYPDEMSLLESHKIRNL